MMLTLSKLGTKDRSLNFKLPSLNFKAISWRILAGLVLLLAFLLRLPLLSGSFWLDEAAQALESARPLAQQLQLAHDFQPPLLHLIVHFALYFGTSEAWLRLVGALIPGLITIWALMLVVKEVASYHFKRHPFIRETRSLTSLLAGLLLATNTWHIFYSQELRPYSLPAMFGVLSWLVIIKNSKLKIKNEKLSTLNLVLLALFTIFGLYSSYLYPFLILSQLAYVSYLKLKGQLDQNRFFGLVISLVVGGLLFLPWLPKLKEQLLVSASLRQTLPAWQTVVSIPQAKGLFLVFAKFVYGVLRVDVNPGWMLLSLLVISLATWLFVFSFKFLSLKKQLMPFLFWFLVPVLASWFLSFLIPVLRPKRMLLALPALQAIWAIIIISNLKFKIKNLKFFLSLVFLGILFAINIYSYFKYLTDPVLQREPWRQIVTQVVSDYPDQAVTVFAYPNPYSPWRWYAPNNYPTLATGKLNINQVKDLKKTLAPVKNYRFAITFDYLSDLTDPEHKLNQQLKAFGFKEVRVVAYPNLGAVRVYEIEN